MSMKLTTTSKTILLGIAFQAVWLSLISSAATDYYWAGMATGLIAYLMMLPRLQRHRMTLPLAITALIGFSFDLVMHYSGVIKLTMTPLYYSWLLLLWLVFVGVFYQLFSWLSSLNSMTSFILGAFGGLAAYYGASLLGAVSLTDQTLFIILYGLFWGASFSLAAKIFVARNLMANRRQAS